MAVNFLFFNTVDCSLTALDISSFFLTKRQAAMDDKKVISFMITGVTTCFTYCKRLNELVLVFRQYIKPVFEFGNIEWICVIMF